MPSYIQERPDYQSYQFNNLPIKKRIKCCPTNLVGNLPIKKRIKCYPTNLVEGNLPIKKRKVKNNGRTITSTKEVLF